MKTMGRPWSALVCAAALCFAVSSKGADTKSYQVTGPVLEITPTAIVVQKGQDKWELSRNPNTKVTGDLKVGSRVTIYYTMVATEVEVKEGKAAGKKAGKAKE